jgi:hypothetical protein
MTDIQTMQQMIAGLKQKKNNLQADEAVFLKLSGINEEIEKALQDKDGYDSLLIEAKSRRDDAKKRKAGAIAGITSKIAQKMNEVLPSGEAVFTYEEDDDGKRAMKIGWAEDIMLKGDGSPIVQKVTPYNGLSGMQKQVFDSALAHVLDADIIVLEAAELDNENLEKTLAELSKLEKQVLVSTCHSLDGLKIPENFTVVEV